MLSKWNINDSYIEFLKILKTIKKKIIKDFGLNFIGSIIFTVTLQLVIYPALAITNSPSMYGVILTVMGIINATVGTLGTSLNNTRLILNKTYEESRLSGDYNIIVLIVGLLSGIIISILSYHLIKANFIIYMALVITGIIATLNSYFEVTYRLNLDFKKLLVYNIVMSIALLLGLIFSHIFKIWILTFFIGYIIGFIYLLFTSTLFNEPYRKTRIFVTSISKYCILVVTSLIANLIMYLDRGMIYPILGGEAVSIFTVASFFGKTLGLVITPIASVLLGYYAQKEFRMNIKIFWNINIITLIIGVLFWIFSIIVAPFFTGLIYPTIIESAEPYILLANTASIIMAIGNITRPAVLSYAPAYWQIVVQVIYGGTYIIFGLIMLNRHGINGFSWASIFASFIRLLLLYFVGTISLKKVKDDI